MSQLNQTRLGLRLTKHWFSFHNIISRYDSSATPIRSYRCVQNSLYTSRGSTILAPPQTMNTRPQVNWFTNETSTSRSSKNTEKEHEARNKTRDLIARGVIKVQEQRNITSLPDYINVTGLDEDFIGFEIGIYQTGRASFPMFIAASSEKENFLRLCKPIKVPHENYMKALSLEYDSENDQYFENGNLVETMETEDAFLELLAFFKRHDNPVLTTFKGKFCSALTLYKQTQNYGLYDEVLEAVPYFINVHNLAKFHVPYGTLTNTRLNSYCLNCLNLNLDDNNSQIDRAIAIRRLFVEYLLPKGFDSNITSLDFYHARSTYAQMFVDGNISNDIVLKLARKGVGLDHLRFLKSEGLDEFSAYLKNNGISEGDIETLLEVV